RPDTEFSAFHHRMFTRVPAIQLTERAGWFGLGETMSAAFLYSKTLSKVVESISRLHFKNQIKDDALRAKLWPTYPVGCKRILFSSNYLPSLEQPNVDVITDGIESITPHGVRTKDGTEHEADVIIYGTGF